MARFRRHTKKEDGVVEYWQSIADIMTALVLTAFLIVAVLVLVIASNAGWLEGKYYDEGVGNYAVEGRNGDRDARVGGGGNEFDVDRDDDYDTIYAGGGGGGAGAYDDPDPGRGEYDDYIRAAVHVTVVDGETGDPIKVEGVSFRLDGRGGIQVLSTYYPTRTDYTHYETTAEGAFFLPEKVRSGTYSLVGLSAPKGYDKAEDVAFDVTENHDWSNPIELTVELEPCKNVVRVAQIDDVTKAPVAGGSWRVLAANDITTADGTVRLKKGELADTFTVDENGKGESAELFLGAYTLEQEDVPEDYAAFQHLTATESLDVTIEERRDSGEPAATCTISLTKTTYVLRVIDQETKQAVSGATFVLTPGDKELQTSKDGVVRFDGLAKGVDYTIHQESGPEGYHLADDISFVVDERGLIDGAARVDTTVNNYVVRVSVVAVGAILGKPLPGMGMALYAKDGSLVREWTTRNTAEWFEGIEPGEYRLVGPDGERAVSVSDNATTQEIRYSLMTVYDYATIAGIVVVALGILGFAAFRVLRRSRKDAE